MIPEWLYLRVRWKDLSEGETVATIAIHEGREYTCGLYTVVSVEDKTLRNFKLTEPNILKEDLLVFRKINPHLRNQYVKALPSLLREPVRAEAKKQTKPS